MEGSPPRMCVRVCVLFGAQRLILACGTQQARDEQWNQAQLHSTGGAHRMKVRLDAVAMRRGECGALIGDGCALLASLLEAGLLGALVCGCIVSS